MLNMADVFSSQAVLIVVASSGPVGIANPGLTI